MSKRGAWWFVFEDKARRERELQLRYESQRMAANPFAQLQNGGIESAAMFSTLVGGSLHLATRAFAMEPVSDDPLAGVVGRAEIILVDDPSDDVEEF